MFVTTPHQKLVLGVLEKTGVLSLANVGALLAAAGAETPADYAERIASQLAHMQKARPAGKNIIVLPHLADAPPDADMLAAVGVMLDVSAGKLLAVKAGAAPRKLCFLVESEKGIGSYAVVIAKPGKEAELNFIFEGARDEKRVLILLIESEGQKEKLKLPPPHFFALPADGKTRYFE
jgi:hypothetical protein